MRNVYTGSMERVWDSSKTKFQNDILALFAEVGCVFYCVCHLAFYLLYITVCLFLFAYSGQIIKGQRSSYQYWYDREWLNTGHMYGLSFLENYSQQNGKKIAATHQLLGDIQHVVEVLNGLQLKINVLQ